MTEAGVSFQAVRFFSERRKAEVVHFVWSFSGFLEKTPKNLWDFLSVRSVFVIHGGPWDHSGLYSNKAIYSEP